MKKAFLGEIPSIVSFFLLVIIIAGYLAYSGAIVVKKGAPVHQIDRIDQTSNAPFETISFEIEGETKNILITDVMNLRRTNKISKELLTNTIKSEQECYYLSFYTSETFIVKETGGYDRESDRETYANTLAKDVNIEKTTLTLEGERIFVEHYQGPC